VATSCSPATRGATALFAPELRGHCGSSWESFRAVLGSAPAWSDGASPLDNLLQRALHFEFTTFLHGLLVTEDHISMAHSLETRVPFLDVALADFAWRIPPSMKLRIGGLADGPAGHLETADGKHILRRAMESYLPAEFVYQKKQGFSPPDENWYRGPSMDYIKTVLWDPRTRQRPWFDQDYVDRLLNEHFEGRCNHRLVIWSLLSIEWIQRHYLDAGRIPLREAGAAVTAAS
jgi:asparagine synthase (glutamine-hydrolysing)